MKLIPINIPNDIKILDNELLGEKLKDLRDEVVYCIEKCNDNIERDKKILEFEFYFTEALLRIMFDKFGYRPYQNKLYEKIDFVFDKKDAYNINRTLSSIRRNRIVGLDFEKTKYRNWLVNRIIFAVTAVVRTLPKYYNEDMIKEFDELIKIKNIKIDKSYSKNK
jgi:hypothetical protein